MKAKFLGMAVLAFVTALVAACASTTPYQSMQTRLQQQMTTLVSLDQKLGATQDPVLRQQLLSQKRQALQEGITLINQAQTDKLDANRACIAREKNLPTSSNTCFEEESLEDAQTRMMSVVLRELVAAETR
ncbi:MAG: hypothetical protein Q8J78_02755 [Moraxellaceae bacterium]|nr:hypothetical protein [Moraxellaceae bacterium]